MEYPRSLAKNHEPFNPIELSEETQKIVINGNKRKYNLFRLEPFYGQIATARGVGCNLRCNFCWINPSRDYPEDYGSFYSPEEVHNKLIEISSNEYGRAIMSRTARISGCEPTLGIDHLFSLIEICKKEDGFKRFLLETNGILLGYDKTIVKNLNKFENYLLVRLSFKAGTPKSFEKKTGAKAEYFDLPFRALEYLIEYKIPYSLAAMSQDPRIMPPEERRSLLKRIIDYSIENIDLLEEEKTDPFGITKTRLIKGGLVNSTTEIRKKVYEPIIHSIKGAVEVNRRSEMSYEELIELGLKEEELKDLFETMEFKTLESPCIACTRKNHWHGHNINDDLDDKLNKF